MIIKMKKALTNQKGLIIRIMIYHSKMKIKEIQKSIFLLILQRALRNSIKSIIQIKKMKIYQRKAKTKNFVYN